MVGCRERLGDETPGGTRAQRHRAPGRGGGSTGAQDMVEHGVFYRQSTGDTAHLSPSRVSTWASSENALTPRSLKKKISLHTLTLV